MLFYLEKSHIFCMSFTEHRQKLSGKVFYRGCQADIVPALQLSVVTVFFFTSYLSILYTTTYRRPLRKKPPLSSRSCLSLILLHPCNGPTAWRMKEALGVTGTHVYVLVCVTWSGKSRSPNRPRCADKLGPVHRRLAFIALVV